MNAIRKPVLCIALVAALLATGCASKKEPATQAVSDAEATLSTFRDEAGEYAATELAAADSAIAGMKANLEKGDYDAVVAGAPALSTQIEALRKTTTERRAEREAANETAKQTWATMSTEVPKMVEAIQSRLDVLGKSRRLPKNLDKAKLETARADFEQMKSSWSDATAAASTGNAIEAVSRGDAAKAKGTDVMLALGMNLAAAS